MFSGVSAGRSKLSGDALQLGHQEGPEPLGDAVVVGHAVQFRQLLQEGPETASASLRNVNGRNEERTTLFGQDFGVGVDGFKGRQWLRFRSFFGCCRLLSVTAVELLRLRTPILKVV